MSSACEVANDPTPQADKVPQITPSLLGADQRLAYAKQASTIAKERFCTYSMILASSVYTSQALEARDACLKHRRAEQSSESQTLKVAPSNLR